MDRGAIIRRLQAHKARLNELGIVSVSLFGSMARGDAGAGSDVDLAVRLDNHFSRGGFDYFARLEALRHELATVLETPVDVIEEPASRPELQVEIDRDRVIAFQ